MVRIIHAVSEGFETEIGKQFDGHAPGLLCGSAISMFAPTCIENGHSTSRNVAFHLARAAGVSGICAGKGAHPEIFERIVADAAYEVILQQHPRRAELPGIFEAYFDPRRSGQAGGTNFNKVHEAIGKLLHDEAIRGIVTTNYDTCIEEAYRSRYGGERLSVVVAESDPRPSRTLFKLHGCATQSTSLVFSLDQEGEMPPWKQSLLGEIAGRHLVVVGYSGSDFEVCPELYDLDLSRLTWIAQEVRGKPALTVNARKVLSRYGDRATVICGDLRKVLAAWCGIGECPGYQAGELLSTKLFECLSESERRLWAARTFVALSIPSAAASAVALERAALAPGEELSNVFESVELDILNHSMQYFENADRSRMISRDGSRDLADRVAHAIGEAGSSSMAGAEQRSGEALLYASHLAAGLRDHSRKEKIEQGIEWMTILHEKGRLSRSDRPAVKELIDRLKVLQDRAFKIGDHHLIDLCEEEISQITGLRRKWPGKRMKKRSGEIFKQMGNYVGQVTALHTRVVKTMSPTLARRLRSHAERMKIFGLPPWRLYQTLIEFEPDRVERELMFSKFHASILDCQLDQHYLRSMIDKARKAVEAPAGLHSLTQVQDS